MANSNNINIDEIRELLNERLNYFSDEINNKFQMTNEQKDIYNQIKDVCLDLTFDTNEDYSIDEISKEKDVTGKYFRLEKCRVSMLKSS